MGGRQKMESRQGRIALVITTPEDERGGQEKSMCGWKYHKALWDFHPTKLDDLSKRKFCSTGGQELSNRGCPPLTSKVEGGTSQRIRKPGQAQGRWAVPGN